jgi:hypothetical protein
MKFEQQGSRRFPVGPTAACGWGAAVQNWQSNPQRHLIDHPTGGHAEEAFLLLLPHERGDGAYTSASSKCICRCERAVTAAAGVKRAG